MIKNKIKILRKKFIKHKIDGYIVPKNDEFFSEYSNKDRLRFISNFTGSAGYAVILKNRNYLFVDGRYTIQSRIESGKNFEILDYFKIINTNVFRKTTDPRRKRKQAKALSEFNLTQNYKLDDAKKGLRTSIMNFAFTKGGSLSSDNFRAEAVFKTLFERGDMVLEVKLFYYGIFNFYSLSNL